MQCAQSYPFIQRASRIIQSKGVTGEEVSIDKQVACEECPRWLKMTEVACEKTEVAVC